MTTDPPPPASTPPDESGSRASVPVPEPATAADGGPAASEAASPLPPAPGAFAAATMTPAPAARPAAAAAIPSGALWLTIVLALLLAIAAVAWAYTLEQRLRLAEQEFARRQQEGATQAVEARAFARQAEAATRELTAKLALVEARVAEVTLQRGQVEELMQALSRSRDENVLADIEAALRVAQQQSAITGGVDPLLTALRQADERLSRMQQPRLERVRRAVLKDIDRVRAAGSVDITTLTLRLDEVARQIDELPLVAAVDTPAARDVRATAPAAAASAPAAGWLAPVQALGQRFWGEARQLVRVTRIDRPEAALLAPDQALFLRENLKLRLLNARLSLLSRQFDAAQSDTRQAQVLLEKYFDRGSRRVQAASELLRQTAVQSQSVVVPRPEATLAALGAAAAGR